MAQAPKEIKAIFAEAIQKTTSEELNLYLDAVCSSNVQLRAEIESLVAAHRDAGEFLAGLLEEQDTELKSPPIEKPGKIVGRYKLLERIGEGGMAVVYMAEQEKPIRRKVALKIIKLGMDTKSVIARFEAERQALAMMDHPNIAKVLDAGATDTGRPYFVMDLVPGLPIIQYCDRNKLSIKERLMLFVSVCNAVQHAHQKGIIHRDVKPSNVMVTQHDGKPVPKVIDFGIAKSINQRLTEKTLFTRYAHMIGTPAYMSPEQAELSDLDVDTRTDIYSLGVLLYELLTGTTPFSEEKLREAGYLHMQKIICEEEPTKPSTKLSTLGEALTDVAEQHNSSPEVMPKLVRGDLDWIVMKTLEKDRARRYDTASALAMDIQRHLDHEPVLARAPKALYRLQKFLRRNRSQTIVAAAIAILILGMIFMLSTWNRNRIQLAEVELFKQERILSQAHESYARRDSLTALNGIKPILDSEHVGPEARLLYANILWEDQQADEAMTILENLRDERPEIAGAAYSLLARILWESESSDEEKLRKVDEYSQQAEELLPETAEAYFLRAMIALTIKEKLEMLDMALSLDPGHYEALRLRALTFFASRKYEQMKDDALGMIVSRSNDPLGYSLRAIALRELGDYEDAMKAYDSAIKYMPEEDPQRIKIYDQRCKISLHLGEYESAIAEAQECLKLFSKGTIFHFHIFCALTALGYHDDAIVRYHLMTDSNPYSKPTFRAWSMKYVFDTLDAGRSWHPPDSKPEGVAFLAMLEADETYHHLSAKAKRLVTDGSSASWSPDGTKLVFSTGPRGYSGLAIYDSASNETDLLIVPGKDPKWSPDGKYIAFVRDCQKVRLSELTVERTHQYRSHAQEEVWILKADGTGPKRLARGSFPSWSDDSQYIYYQSHIDRMLYSISFEDKEAQPKPILSCSNPFPSVSPDGKYMAYVESATLKIRDMASQSLVADWAGPLKMWRGNWAPEGHEFNLGGIINREIRTGLWIYDLNTMQGAKVLSGQITAACWSQDRAKLVFSLGPPFHEIWVAPLDPNVSTIEALGPGRTLEEHYQEVMSHYSRRIESDPEDAESHFYLAQYYHYLHDKEEIFGDMDKYISIFTPSEGANSRGSSSQDLLVGLSLSTPTNLGRIVNSTADEASPSISTDGLELYFDSNRSGGSGDWDIWVTKRQTTSDPWEEPMNLGPAVNSSGIDWGPSISADRLTLYFASLNRHGVLDNGDIWVATRATTEEDWSTVKNLGPMVNSASLESGPSISADGLSLFFTSERSGGYGGGDLWITTRTTTGDDWGLPVNLGDAVNSSVWDGGASISGSGLVLFFDSVRPGGLIGYGGNDIWMATRETIDDDWDPPVNLGPAVNTAFAEILPGISANGLELYFSDGDGPRPDGIGGADLWRVSLHTMSDGLETDGDFQSLSDGSQAEKERR